MPHAQALKLAGSRLSSGQRKDGHEHKTTIDRNEAQAIGPLPADHPPVKIHKVGVLLVNLGTPDGTDYWSMRRYLKEFLTDKRVIEWPKALWYPILFGIVLNTRPGKVGKAYEDDLEQGARRELSAHLYALAGREAWRGAGRPSGDRSTGGCVTAIRRSMSGMTALRDQGCDRILVFPLYPQYSAATTATVNDKAFESLMADAVHAGDPHRAGLS
jgi:ferrochelatase